MIRWVLTGVTVAALTFTILVFSGIFTSSPVVARANAAEASPDAKKASASLDKPTAEAIEQRVADDERIDHPQIKGQREAEPAGDKTAADKRPGPPKMAPGSNPAVTSVAAAADTGRDLERISMHAVDIEKQGMAAFLNDRVGYIRTVVPSRVYAVKQPGKGIKALTSLSAGTVILEPGSSTALKVKGEPKSPVTFTSFDSGAFENGISSTTVMSDKKGQAKAKWTATGGVAGPVGIKAGSPATSGVVDFEVVVKSSKLEEGG